MAELPPLPWLVTHSGQTMEMTHPPGVQDLREFKDQCQPHPAGIQQKQVGFWTEFRSSSVSLGLQLAAPAGFRQHIHPARLSAETWPVRPINQGSGASRDISSDRNGIYALGKTHKRCTPSLSSYPPAVCETGQCWSD